VLETDRMRRSKSDYSIQTVSNALRVLEAFGDEEELGVTELARRLGLHKNNVFRLLATLEEKGYVAQTPRTDRYRLGVRCLELGRAYSRNHSLARLARPVLEDLSRTTGETAHIGTLSDFEVVHLDGEQSDRIVTTGLRVGRRLDAHCTALGKVLLASAQPGLWERFAESRLQDGRLRAATPATISDRHKFLDHLQAVASQGFATDLEECSPGLCCAAAPVVDGSGQCVAAISISAPIFRLGEEALVGEVVPHVIAGAGALSQRLGHAA
jgi:IclR family KDG regulon transcriptional repressor